MPLLKNKKMTVRSNAQRKRFSEFLDYLKSDQGYLLTKVTDNIGISVQALYKIKRGESNPSKQTVMLMQIKYGLNPTWYETGREEMVVSTSLVRVGECDETLLELMRMKNSVIAALDEQFRVLKRENTILKKQLRA